MKKTIALISVFIALHVHADGIVALKSVPDDKAAVRNGALLFARVDVEVLNATEAQSRLPVAIGLFPKDKRSVDLLSPSGKPLSAEGCWMALVPGKNLILVSPPAGVYYWRSVQAGGARTTYSAPLGKEGAMSIALGAVTYVGDLKVILDFGEMRAKASILEVTQDAMQELKSFRPALSEAFEPKVSIATLGGQQ